VRESAIDNAHHFLLSAQGSHAKSILIHVFRAAKHTDASGRAAMHRMLQRIHLT
jgi:hypothetical protein